MPGFKSGIFLIIQLRLHHKKADLIAVVNTVAVQVAVSAKKRELKEWDQRGLLAELAPMEEAKQGVFHDVDHIGLEERTA